MSAPDSEILIGDQSSSADKASADANADLLAELQPLKACVAALEEKARKIPEAEAEPGKNGQSTESVKDEQTEAHEVPLTVKPPRPAKPRDQDPAPTTRTEQDTTPAKPRDQDPAPTQRADQDPVPTKRPDRVPTSTKPHDEDPAPTARETQPVTRKVPARPGRPAATDNHKTNGRAVKDSGKSKPARPDTDRKKVPRPVPLGAAGPAASDVPARPSETAERQPDSKSDPDQQPADETAKPRRRWLAALLFRESIPGWSASMIVHAIGIVTLALLTLSLPEEKQEIPIVANAADVVQDLEEIEEELELEVEKPIVEEFVPDVSDVIEDPGEAIMGDLNQTETAAPSDLGDLATIDVGALGLDVDLMGDGKGKKGDGLGVASFFGVTTRGRKFMYVVDNSNSMNNGKFEMACNELFKSISGLSYDHEFYIIFYSDAAYPLFYPHTAPRWVKATPDNVDKVRYWLDEVHRCLQTRGEEAMTKAFQMRPDVIYLLGDGSFTDKAVPTTLAFNDPNVVVHTMGFRMKEAARKGFEDISTKFKGKFHEVEVIPEAVEASKRKNRPKNNQQNGVWGINLGKGKKKK